MIENKNTPEKFAKSDKLIAPKTRKNWDSVHSWTGSPGLFMPIKNWDIPKNASVSLRPLTQFETLPTVSPLKGHYIQRYEYFFCPYRLYLPNLINDNVNEIEDIENMDFPFLGNDRSKFQYSAETQYSGKSVIISNGHLFKYLGYPTLVQIHDVEQEPLTVTLLFTDLFSIGAGPVMPFSNQTSASDLSRYLLFLAASPYNAAPAEYSAIIDAAEDPLFFVKSVYGYSYNAVPFLAYIDIFMNFVANPSENYVYNLGTEIYTEESGANPVYGSKTILISTPFKVMQSIVPAVRRTGYNKLIDIPDENGALSDYDLTIHKTLPTLTNDDVSAYLGLGFEIKRTHFGEGNAGQSIRYNPFVYLTSTPYNLAGNAADSINQLNKAVDNGGIYNHDGMFLVPYLPDYFTTWLDPDDIQFSRQIVSSDMSVQSLRLAERKWADFGRQIVNRSKRYTSWLETAFGVNGPTLNMDTKPIWVGRDDIMVNFQNITSNAETDKTTYTGSLGSNVSRADFNTQYNDVKPIRFTTQEPGLLMCVSYIVPEVSYGKGVDKFLLKRKFGDLYRVPYDAIGFQTTDSRELDAGCSNPGINIGYNISWVEYMTKVNTHVGLFNTKPFRSWLLSRETIESDTVPMPGVPTKPDPWYLQNSTYIDPDMFNHSFVSIGQGTDNFIVQTLFNFDCKLPMSNQILNTRW